MKYYLAPMEGITGYIYRNAYHECFSPFDKYFTPFITPNQNKKLHSKDLNDVLPENNQGIPIVPQLLTNHSEDFIWTAKRLEALGYEEVNLNLGCPSKTVVTKRKGAGFLAYPLQLEGFLEEIFNTSPLKISIKTRIGMEDPEEFFRLMDIYNQYPIEELIVHPRLQTDYYKNIPNLKMFQYACDKSKSHICYNGDLFTPDDFKLCKEKFPYVDTWMFGRGILMDPGMLDVLRGRKKREKEDYRKFHDKIYHSYKEYMSGDRNVLFKMKELWFYMGGLFVDSDKNMKKLKKSQKLPDYHRIVDEMFQDLSLR
ncbi:MAG TPA: tRNA-dihydrouridine synthase family protein [Candidatus Merdenecus merdavium]|nr:tRNA-dihydrouridine synthase family protein [Candidatus Merdenecus merdavium]